MSRYSKYVSLVCNIMTVVEVQQSRALLWVLQVREKDDRHQQKKLDGFLRPRAELDAAASASAAPDVDMEVKSLIYQ